MARWAVDRLDSVETIRMTDEWRDLTPNAQRFVTTRSIQTFTDEFAQNAVVCENRTYKELPPTTLGETIMLPYPIGEVEVFTTLHSELATFPKSFEDKGIRNVNWKEGGPTGWQSDFQLIVELGLASEKPLKMNDAAISPRKFLLKLLASRNLLGHPKNITPDDWECSRVEAVGKKSSRAGELRLEILYHSKKEWKASTAQYGAGIPDKSRTSRVVRHLGSLKYKKTRPTLRDNYEKNNLDCHGFLSTCNFKRSTNLCAAETLRRHDDRGRDSKRENP